MRVKLIQLRKERQISQDKVAKDLGISRAFYGMIEQASRNPTLRLAKEIAKYYGTSIEEIFFNDYCNK
jgi:putative transcriptional regulator